MANTDQRRFEVATDGSDFAETLCHAVLEPKADSLALEPFRDSRLDLVEQTRRWAYENDTYISIEFLAQKYTLNDEGEPVVMYNPSITVTRPRRANEAWPDMDGLEIEWDNEDESEDEDTEVFWPGSVACYDAQEGPAEDHESDEGEEIDEKDYCYVQEVWDYYLEDDHYQPRKNVRCEYYIGQYCVGVVSPESPLTTAMILEDDVNTEISLQINDAALYKSFSELDVLLIEAICAFDFKKIYRELERSGCFDEDAAC